MRLKLSRTLNEHDRAQSPQPIADLSLDLQRLEHYSGDQAVPRARAAHRTGIL
jgi:hypothetical protein